MAVFKCKICGGSLEIEPTQSVATCEYCGTKQTLPKLSDERRANLYDRAGHFRRNNDFDKAVGIFEQILNDDPTDAEAYWSLVLCRYGIEYVKDPATGRRLPTVNRAQYTSVFDDEDYKSAIAHADAGSRALYEAEAAVINELQKDILAISQKEEPFDVFICYKETDQGGRRTRDSVIATDLYQELTREGFKVFFSRITLEDKLGSAYEPYIFAALQSAKVMVVLGTEAAHFNAAWVKNEWSRYLSLIKNGARKTLIPAYRDMDPYDLPEEFSHLQAQDMSRLGFMQDLVRGIKKLVGASAQKTAPAGAVGKSAVTEGTPAVNMAPADISPLLERAFLFLEDGEFDRADDFCEQILNRDPRNARAYLCKLMTELELNSPEQLGECPVCFEENVNYQRALRFGDAALQKELRHYAEVAAYARQRQADEAEQWQLYQAMKSINETENPIYALEDAMALLKRLQGLSHKPYAAEMIPACEEKIEELRECVRRQNALAEKKRRKRKRNLMIVCVCALLLGTICSISAVLYNNWVVNIEKDGIHYTKKGHAYYIDGYTENISTVTIPEHINGIPIVGILSNAFEYCHSLTSIIIPSSVTEIEHSAFFGCSNLISITIPFVGSSANPSGNTHLGYIFGGSYNFAVPDSLQTVIVTGGTQIGEDAFRHCEHLVSVTLPESITSIGEYAFENCSSLTSITIPSKVTNIAKHAFWGCSNLSSVTIPSSITSINDGAFMDCNNLTAVHITDLATWCNIDFGESANPLMYAQNLYINNDLLTNAEIPNTVTEIKQYAFYNCTSIVSISLPPNLTTIGAFAFEKCNNLSAVYISDLEAWCNIDFFAGTSNPLYYAHNLYLNQNRVTTLKIPSTVKNIKQHAFTGCNISSVTLPSSLESIGDGVFRNCYNLSSITIPSKVNHIGYSAFNECTHLALVFFEITSGWRVNSSSSSTYLSSANLSYPSLAASYFTSTYRYYQWDRN